MKFECDDECKVQVRTDKGKLKECGRLCDRKGVHGLKDCERRNHITERQYEDAKSETRFKVPREIETEEEMTESSQQKRKES